MQTSFRAVILVVGLFLGVASAAAADGPRPTAAEVLDGLRQFFARTARPDGSFQNSIDPAYAGMSDSAYSDLAAVTYACTIHKTFGWKLPHEEATIRFLHRRQRESGEFFNVAGTVDPQSPQGHTYNTTQGLVALKALGVAPKFDALPVFEKILAGDYKTLPSFSTSFFPLAYLCAGKPIPERADRDIRALMIQDETGYLDDHVAATFHASHYYSLVGEPTPKARQMVDRILRDQKADGSWMLNLPSRDRHATFDAVFTLVHEGAGREDCRAAVARAGQWALACRNADGGFGHYPGSTSDADANYFHVGTLVMAGVLKPVDPPPPDAHLLSWGHMIPVRKAEPMPAARSLEHNGWVSGVAFSPDGTRLATGSSDRKVRLWDTQSGKLHSTLEGHGDYVANVAFDPAGRRLTTASYDHTAKIWDLASNKPLATLTGHAGAVLAVTYAGEKPVIATGSIDTTIRLYDIEGAFLRALTGHKSWVNALAASPDKKTLASASSDGTVKLWAIPSGDLLQTLPATKAEVRSVAWSPDGKRLAAGMRYGAIKVWWTADWSVHQAIDGRPGDCWALAFLSDGEMLSAEGDWNRASTVRSWRTADWQPASGRRHLGEVLGIAVSPRGEFIAAGGGDRTVTLWRLK
jgi:geranylgeranyl transferase type-2 subunit beta